MFAGPALPVLGTPREGPLGIEVQMPLGWRKIGAASDRISYTNGLSTAWRSSATVLAVQGCGAAADLVRGLVAQDLWRVADVGALRAVDVSAPQPIEVRAMPALRVAATVLGEEGQAHLDTVCIEQDQTALAVLVLQPISDRPARSGLSERIARTLRWPVLPSQR